MLIDRKHMEIRHKVWFNSYDTDFFLKKFIFIFIYVYLHVSCIYATCVWVPTGSEGSSRCSGLDLEAAVKHPVWMLRTTFQSFPRAARTLNHSIISLALLWHFLIGKALLWWQNLVASEGGDWLGEDERTFWVMGTHVSIRGLNTQVSMLVNIIKIVSLGPVYFPGCIVAWN